MLRVETMVSVHVIPGCHFLFLQDVRLNRSVEQDKPNRFCRDKAEEDLPIQSFLVMLVNRTHKLDQEGEGSAANVINMKEVSTVAGKANDPAVGIVG